MEIDKYIIILTFIPWLLIFIVSTINNLNNPNYKSFSFKYLRNNIFKIFRLDTLLLIIAFWYFSSFNREFVSQYLFSIMCLYLFVNFFYEKRQNLEKGFWKANILNIILLIIIMSIPFILYYNNYDLDTVYKLMLIYLFGEYIIILLVSYITKLIKFLLKKIKGNKKNTEI